jgi:hypothetical protein
MSLSERGMGHRPAIHESVRETERVKFSQAECRMGHHESRESDRAENKRAGRN